MATTARFWTKLALALALLLAGATALVFHAHQHASSLDEVWPDKPTASRGAAPPLAAQHAALAPAGALGITIELPVGDHWGERDRAAKLFAALLAQEYRAAWTSRWSDQLGGVIPEELWPCLAALDAGTSEDFDVFNRWLLDPKYRLSRPGCTPPATTPTSYVRVRFAFVQSADAPRIANMPISLRVALIVAGIASITGGLMRCIFILLTRHRIARSAQDHDGDGTRARARNSSSESARTPTDD